MSAIDLRQQRATLVNQAREILNRVESEKRNIAGEEQQQYDRIMVDVDAMKATIDRLERQDALDAEMRGSVIEPVRPEVGGPETRGDATGTASKEYRDAFVSYVRAGHDDLAPEQRKLLAAHRVTGEARALGVGTGGAGLYTVPQGFLNSIMEAMKAYGGMRASRATVLRTTAGNDLPMPTVNDAGNMGELLAENTVAASQDVAFGQVTLKAYKYSSKIVPVSIELLQDTAIDLEAKLAQWLATRIARITNLHFTTGTGTNQPQGAVTGSFLGKTGTTGQTTSIIFDDIIDLTHSVDPVYRQQAEYMFHDTTLKALKKLKDTQQRPLWLPGLAMREPDTINGYPYVINQDMPVMAANAKSILFGDLSTYNIRDVLDIQLVRFAEKFMDAGQIAFLAFYRGDGKCVDAGTHPISYYANSAT